MRERAELALNWAQQNGINPRVTSAFRSLSEQAELRARWEAGLSPFPANRPGDSAHNFAFAWDSTLPDSVRGRPAWESWWIAVREWAGFSVPSNDTIHAEVPGWRRFI